jgi:acyl-CoA reductase-like NAD-dependent aldehyde dehydrogenase
MSVIEVRSPFDRRVVGTVQSAMPDDVDRAVERAWAAFESQRLLPIDRRNVLDRAATLLAQQSEEWARLICSEMGKPIRDCRTEVERACTTLSWCAEESLRIEGLIQPCGVTPQHLDRTAFVERVPVGVVVAITPFNFPLNIPVHKVGPALAAGNAAILKPSPKAPLAGQRLIELLHEAGLPEGMAQVLHGGAEVVERLARSPVSAVSFTGSTQVGHRIAEWAAGKKVVMELGGNDPIVVMDDADLDAAARAILAHRFGSSGQRCTACKRALLHNAVYDQTKERLVDGIGRLVVGDPASEKTDVGPLIDEEAATRVMAKLDDARSRGATILCGGRRKGGIVDPTLVENVDPGSALCQEETFGPVLPLFRFSDFGEAVRLVNGQPYGLQSGLFTNRMSIVREAFRRFQVGAVIVNDGPGLRVEPIPFGGVKASGHGREGVRCAIEEFTVLKTLVW